MKFLNQLFRYVPRPNRLSGEDLLHAIYVPQMIDRSVVDILRHRGVAEDRISAVIMDLDYRFGLAAYELDALLPTTEASRYSRDVILFSAVLGPGVIWTGSTLTLEPGKADLPDTVMAALPGKPLRQVAGHPALPDRTIVAAARLADGSLQIEVESDRVPVLTLSSASRVILRNSRRRCSARRRLADAAVPIGDEDWCWWIENHRKVAAEALLRGRPEPIPAWC